MNTGTKLAIAVFLLVAILHGLRLLAGTAVTVGEYPLPLWVSVPGVLLPGLIAWLLWKESKG